MRRSNSLKATLAKIAFVLVFTFLAGEIAVRLLTTTTPTGLKKFFSVALLPLRPDAQQVREALDQLHKDRLLVRDPDIGWIVRPGRSDDGDYTNAQGIRTNPDRSFTDEPPKGKIRIQTIGESFIYGLQVKNGETWQDYLEQKRGDLEFVNFGIPGGATDQAFLRWRRDGKRFKSHIVLLGVWPDQIFRDLAILDFYRTNVGLAMTKPRFILEKSGDVKLVNYPVMSDDDVISTLSRPDNSPRVQYDYWYP